MIHQAAGPGLLKDRLQIGSIEVGNAVVTKAHRLHAKYVIHTVGPSWKHNTGQEAALLRQCYDRSLELAVEHGCESIAFPLISSGNYGCPKETALQIAIDAFSSFLTDHELQIYLVVFDRAAFQLTEKRFHAVSSYIDEHYVDACQKTYETMEAGFHAQRVSARQSLPCATAAPSLQDILKQEDAGFTETLLSLIDQRGLKDSQVYKKANLSKQHFSKIRNNLHYRPTKSTALALALALELDLKATRDLIGRAGYALTNSSKFDLIVRYFIEQGNFNVVDINLTLYEFDQPLLGS
jgi:O-acetyl-ADP-ribose deacetylase (regulator of RNase III)